LRSYRLAPSFLHDVTAIEADLSPADNVILDRAVAAIVASPLRIRRAQSFYDPSRPSWLTRCDPFIVHYAYDQEADEVILLNVFRRR
jgi:hypothetical protein